MKPRISRKWIHYLCIALIPLFLMTGCAKRDAQKSLTAAETVKTEAQDAQAPRYAPQAFQQANTLLTRAQSEFDRGEYEQAKASAEQAAARFVAAQQQVIEVKPRVDRQIADIRDSLDQGDQYIQEAREHNADPADVNPVANQLDEFRTRLDEEYRTVISEQALNDFLAEINIVVVQSKALATQHLQPDAMQAKNDIEQLITEAQQLKADQHVPDKYATVIERFKDIETAEQDGKWQEMIDIANELTTPLNEIITAAQEKAAGDIIEEVLSEIAKAKQLNIQDVQAFPTSISQAEQTLQTGQEELKNQAYAAAIAAANEARRILNDGYLALSDAAQQNVQTAETNLEEAVEKEASQYAPQVLAQAREAIAGVKELNQNEQYAQAYLNSKKVVQTSQDVITAARRGKAQAALARVEKPFSLLHGQGGETYVPDAYKNAESSIQTLRDLMKQGDYEQVQAGADAAVAVVQKGIDALSQAAQNFIDNAEQALEKAKVAKAPEWVGMQHANAVNLKSAAIQELEKENFLSSIRKSEAAIDAANSAEGKAYQLRAKQNLGKADDFMALAKQARQDQLSPLAYRKASDSIEQTNSLIANNEFENAYHQSVEATDLADKALNNLIITAQNKTDSALDAESMTYSEPEIKEALALLNQAEAAQKERQYETANEKAIQSADLAEEAEHFTWKQRSYSLLRHLDGTKEKLEHHLAPIKKPSLYNDVLKHLAEAKVLQIEQNYKTSYEEADAARQARDDIWNGMRSDLEQVAKEVGDTAAWISENALDVSGRDKNIALLNHITELNRLISLENWKEAYAAAEELKALSQNTLAEVENQNRTILAAQLQEKIQEYEQQDALYIVPEKRETLENTLNALASPEEEQTYAELHKMYEEAVATIDQMPDSIITLATQRTEELASTLQQAQEAGAMKYYADWFRMLSSDLQWLRNSIRGDDYQGISERLRNLENDAPKILVATRTAVEEDSYLQNLKSYLTQMDKTIQDFGFIGSMPKNLIISARSTEHKLDETVTDMYRALQGKLSTRNFELTAANLEESVKELTPPETLKDVQEKAVKSFTHFRRAAEGFHMYGQTDTHDLYYRERALEHSYEHLYKTLDINEDLMFAIESHRKMGPLEKFKWNMEKFEDRIGDFYFSYDTR